MKIENQVVTIEQAKKLKELGVTQDTLYAFYHHWEINKMVYSLMLKDSDSINESFAAPTVAELGVMLPEEIGVQRKDGKWQVMANKLLYPFPHIQEGHNRLIVYSDYSEAEAKAQMLIMLLENNLTTPEEVNQRLNS